MHGGRRRRRKEKESRKRARREGGEDEEEERKNREEETEKKKRRERTEEEERKKKRKKRKCAYFDSRRVDENPLTIIVFAARLADTLKIEILRKDAGALLTGLFALKSELLNGFNPIAPLGVIFRHEHNAPTRRRADIKGARPVRSVRHGGKAVG